MNNHSLIIKNLKYANANAISGLTYGFPSIGAILGFIEKLNIEINKRYDALFSLSSVIILSHDTNCRVYREHPGKDFSFIQKRHPLDKDGETAPILQEGYIDGDISLIVKLENVQLVYDEDFNLLKNDLISTILKLKFAGGTICAISDLIFTNYKNLKSIIKSLYPFAALVCRRNYLKDLLDNHAELDIIDAFLSLSSTHYRYDKKTHLWSQLYAKDGFLVPLHVGYKQISRDFTNDDTICLRSPDMTACFVEPIFSVGEWLCSYQKLNEIIDSDYECASWKYFHIDSYFLFSSAIL